MSFEYNDNLNMIERIKLVNDEIKQTYPLIDNTSSIMAATLSSPIDDKPTNSDKFERYYYMLMYLDKSNPEYFHIFNDMYDLYEDGIENLTFNNCMIEIIKYVSQKRDEFPLLQDFY